MLSRTVRGLQDTLHMIRIDLKLLLLWLKEMKHTHSYTFSYRCFIYIGFGFAYTFTHIELMVWDADFRSFPQHLLLHCLHVLPAVHHHSPLLTWHPPTAAPLSVLRAGWSRGAAVEIRVNPVALASTESHAESIRALPLALNTILDLKQASDVVTAVQSAIPTGAGKQQLQCRSVCSISMHARRIWQQCSVAYQLQVTQNG